MPTTFAEAIQRLQQAEADNAQLQSQISDEEARTKFAKEIGKAAVETAKVASGSNEAVNNTVAEQGFRAVLQPGYVMGTDGRALLVEVLGVTDKKVSEYQNQFKASNPRMNPASPQFDAGGRKGTKLVPNKAFGANLRKHTVTLGRGTARKMDRQIGMTLDVLTAFGKAENPNFTRDEARKYLTGYCVKSQSGSVRVKKSLFTGLSPKVRHDKP